MDSLTLLAQAHAAGLTVSAEGDRLVVRGPRSAEAVAQRLLAPAFEVVDATYQRIWFDYALRDGTYTPEELRQARKVLKPWGPVRTYHLVAVQQYSEPLGRWLLVITEASGDVPPDARFLTPVAGGKALAWLTAAQLRQRACESVS